MDNYSNLLTIHNNIGVMWIETYPEFIPIINKILEKEFKMIPDPVYAGGSSIFIKNNKTVCLFYKRNKELTKEESDKLFNKMQIFVREKL